MELSRPSFAGVSAKAKRPGKPGRFVRCAMLLLLAHAAPHFA
jgi:hypothetical protein